MIKSDDFLQTMEILNGNLMEICLESYSIQIEIVNSNSPFFVLRFSSDNKKEIIKDFFKINHNFKEHKLTYRMFEKTQLEFYYLYFISNGVIPIPSDTKVSIFKKKMNISFHENSLYYIFYEIISNSLIQKEAAFQDLVNLLKESNYQGYMITYVTNDNSGELRYSSYVVELNNDPAYEFDLLTKVNEFFKTKLLEIPNIKLEIMAKFLWRLPISNVSYFARDLNLLFSSRKSSITSSTQELLSNVEERLNQNEILFEKLNSNSILISQKYIFTVITHLNLDIVIEFIKKYVKTYGLYIYFTREEHYSQIMAFNHITEIKNLTLLTKESYHSLDISQFR